MKAVRIVRRTIMVAILVLPAGVVGTVVALGWSPPGRRFTSRLAEQLITESVAGHVAIGSIDGNLLNHVILRHISISDSLNASVIVAERIEAHYDVLELLSGKQMIFTDVMIDSATVHLVRTAANRWNYENVFRTSTEKGTTPPAQIELRNLTLRQVSLRVDVASTPGPTPIPISKNATPLPLPRFENGPDGMVRVRTLEKLDARISLVRVSTPARDPLLLRIDSLSTFLSDPDLEIRQLAGQITTAGDSLNFNFRRVVLPGTALSGAGRVRWPRGPMLMDFTLDAETVDLKDLRWVSPDFPDWHGRGRVVAHSQSDTRTSYRLENLRLGDGTALAEGSLIAVVDDSRGLGMQSLKLAMVDVPLAIMRPYLDTLPFAGTLTGRLLADGFFDAMRLGGDLLFADALVDRMPRSHFVFDGMIHFGGNEGAVFDEFRLDESAIDLGTVRRVVPAMEFPGMLRLVGRLDGAWTNVRFNGTTEHVAPDQSRSRLVGAVAMDTRQTLLRVNIDGNFDQLSFDALRSAYPGIKARGGLTGHFAAAGRIDSLTIDAALSGEIGTFHASGNLQAVSPTFGTDSLHVEFARINSDALLGKFGSTSFNGAGILRGRVDSLGGLHGTLAMMVDPSRIGAVAFDGAVIRLHADSGMMTIDTMQAELPEGWFDMTGNLGLDSAHAGKLVIDAGFRSLTPFDSLARAYLGFTPDTIAPHALDGTVQGNFIVTGSVGDPSVKGTLQARSVILDRWHIAKLVGDIGADSLGDRKLELSIDGDSLGHAGNILERTRLRVSGRADSVRFAIDGQMYKSKFAALGTWQQKSTGGFGLLDSLALNNPGQQWRLTAPTHIAWTDGRPVISDTTVLKTLDGGGEVTLAGALPGTTAGELFLSAVGLEIQDIASLIQRDSSTLGGTASIDFKLGGTASAPTLRGSTAITGPTMADVRIPLIRAAFDYQNQVIRSQITFWKTGDPLLQAEVSLPYNLAFKAEGDRKLPGPIDIVATSDSADLALLEAFTSSVRSATGLLNLAMHATGTWKAPRLDGLASIDHGALVLPDLGVEYTDINGDFRFTGDSMVVDTLHLTSSGGTAKVAGFLRFEQLVKPSFGLDVTLDEFLVNDVPGDMTIRPSGDLHFRGPLLRPVMTGAVALSRSQLYYSDLINKTLPDLEDPAFADLVDTAAMRRKGLGVSFQNRFLNALRIDNLKLRVNEDVWLRSPEANILLTSAGTVTINKNGKEYEPQGEFNTTRGTYTYSFQNLVNKDFDIQRGVVQFYGTSLNAKLDLEATHTVRTDDEGDVEILAKITGTILVPIFQLSSPGRSIPEIDLLSLLIFKQRAYKVQVSSRAATILLQASAASVFSGAINQALFSKIGLGLTFTGLFDDQYGLSLRQQLTSRASIGLNASYCKTTQDPSYGLSADYRLGGGFRIQLSRDPIQPCLSNRASDLLRQPIQYQSGFGLFWKRDY